MDATKPQPALTPFGPEWVAAWRALCAQIQPAVRRSWAPWADKAWVIPPASKSEQEALYAEIDRIDRVVINWLSAIIAQAILLERESDKTAPAPLSSQARTAKHRATNLREILTAARIKLTREFDLENHRRTYHTEKEPSSKSREGSPGLEHLAGQARVLFTNLRTGSLGPIKLRAQFPWNEALGKIVLSVPAATAITAHLPTGRYAQALSKLAARL